MAREGDITQVQPDTIFVGTGVSTFIFVPPQPFQLSISIQVRGTGGSLEIAGGGPSFFYNPASFAINSYAASLVANGSGWPIATSTIYTINGPAAFWLSSGGATTTVSVLRSFAQSYK